jgi:hypothetical protein
MNSLLGCEFDDRLPCPEEMDRDREEKFDFEEIMNDDLAFLRKEWREGTLFED